MPHARAHGGNHPPPYGPTSGKDVGGVSRSVSGVDNRGSRLGTLGAGSSGNKGNVSPPGLGGGMGGTSGNTPPPGPNPGIGGASGSRRP